MAREALPRGALEAKSVQSLHGMILVLLERRLWGGQFEDFFLFRYLRTVSISHPSPPTLAQHESSRPNEQ